MEKLFTILLVFSFATGLFSQTPEKMSYQAVVRDVADELIKDQIVGMQFSIIHGTPDGEAVYVETQIPTTNGNGLVSIEIGAGTTVSGDFVTIDWSKGPYFIKTETDPNGGENYTITGTSQLLSVPYALHSKTAETVTGIITENDPSVPSGTQTGEMQYWNGSVWVTVPVGNEGQVLTFSGGVPTWTTTIGPTDVYNPVTGKIWMDKNLGASQVALNSIDASSYGDLYQWGRANDGHEKRTSVTNLNLSDSDSPGHSDFITTEVFPYDWRSPQNDNLWQGVSGTNNPCPNGYRLPTEAEWESELTSWSSNDSAGAFDSPLRLSVAGFRYGSNGSLDYVGSYGLYWSSTVVGTSSRYLYFNGSTAAMHTIYRTSGYSVRCIKD